MVIIICPSCDAQYRLPDAVLVLGKRMRCADCEHRWTIEPPSPDAPSPVPADEPCILAPDIATPSPAQTAQGPELEVQEAEAPVTASPGPEVLVADESADARDDDHGRGARWPLWVAGLVIVLVAGFVGLVALERVDPRQVPVVGGLLAEIQPQASPLVIEAAARLTPLPGGALLLEVNGVVRNTGRSRVDVGTLKAMLGGEGSVARRWTIALPITALAPGEAATFSSTLTDVPGGARQLRLATG